MLSTSPYSDLQVPEIAVQSTSVCSILSWHVWKVPATDGASIWLSIQHPEQFERATLVQADPKLKNYCSTEDAVIRIGSDASLGDL